MSRNVLRLNVITSYSIHYTKLYDVHDTNGDAYLSLDTKSLPDGVTLTYEELYSSNGATTFRVYLTAVTADPDTDHSDYPDSVELTASNQFYINVVGSDSVNLVLEPDSVFGSEQSILINTDEFVKPNSSYHDIYDISTNATGNETAIFESGTTHYNSATGICVITSYSIHYTKLYECPDDLALA